MSKQLLLFDDLEEEGSPAIPKWETEFDLYRWVERLRSVNSIEAGELVELVRLFLKLESNDRHGKPWGKINAAKVRQRLVAMLREYDEQASPGPSIDFTKLGPP